MKVCHADHEQRLGIDCTYHGQCSDIVGTTNTLMALANLEVLYRVSTTMWINLVGMVPSYNQSGVWEWAIF